MKNQLEQRIKELKNEFESGQKMLAELESKQANLRDALLRISGAILVLEEELDKFNRDETELFQQSNLKSEASMRLETEGMDSENIEERGFLG